MIKIITSEEYSKLTVNLDYWKTRALEEEKRKNFYENLYKSEKARVVELIRENQSLDKKLEEFEKEIYNEHQCNRHCFTEHVLPAIQRDYNECNYNSHLIRHKFIEYWSEKLSSEYDFVSCICLMNGKIAVKYN